MSKLSKAINIKNFTKNSFEKIKFVEVNSTIDETKIIEIFLLM